MAELPSSDTSLLFTVTDPYQNPIGLNTKRWNHILEHRDMAGRLELIADCVAAPNAIYHGATPTRFVFDAYNRIPRRSNIVRAVVEYGNSVITEGGTEGMVVTAYLPIASDTGQIGTRIFLDFKAGR